MALFLIVDPTAARRGVLKLFLQPDHKVVECSSCEQPLPAGSPSTFTAAFIAWPDGLGRAAAQKPAWSCVSAVVLLSDPAQAASAEGWCKRILGKDRITFVEGRLAYSELSRALNCVLAKQESPPEMLGATAIMSNVSPNHHPTSAGVSHTSSQVAERPKVVPEMLGSTPELLELRRRAAQVAVKEEPALICGEAGTGKEALARWIHARSARNQGPFVTFDCTLFSPEYAASELFGHERGAFPWAVQPRRGLLATADGGTLFIRDIGALDLALQSKLSRLLDDQVFERLGGEEPHYVDVRLVAGSCYPLRDRLGAEFSRELYHQLRQNYLEIPPLRARLPDIPELARHFIAKTQGFSDGIISWDPRALSACQRYRWPGNLNELDEVLAEAVLRMQPDRKITFDLLPARIQKLGDNTRSAAIPTPSGRPENGSQEEWPKPGDVIEGYRLLPKVFRTAGARVFLAEVVGNVLRIAKFSDARNEHQLDAVKKIIALSEKEREARNFMIPILTANARAADKWCMIVLNCLDDVRTGQDIDRALYQPHTFGRWIERQRSSQDRWAIINHLEAMLHALDFFHRRDLIMNDAKPENFGFFEGRLVIIDYGGFAFRGQPPHEFTLAYSPPEVREGKPAEDIYAVSVMMAEALYNIPPEELTPGNVPALAERYQAEGDLFDKVVWELLKRKGLSPFPGLRFQDAPSMINQLQELKRLLKEEPPEPEGPAAAPGPAKT